MEGRFASRARLLLPMLVLALPFVVLGAPSSGPTSAEISEGPLKLPEVSPNEHPGPMTQEIIPSDDLVPHPKDALDIPKDDQVAPRRQKREFYDRDPWGRMPEDKPYYRRRGGGRITRYNTRKFSRGRRGKHQGYRGPDYGDNVEEAPRGTAYSGYVDTSAFDNQSAPKRNFVSARASGVARKETPTGGDI